MSSAQPITIDPSVSNADAINPESEIEYLPLEGYPGTSFVNAIYWQGHHYLYYLSAPEKNFPINSIRNIIQCRVGNDLQNPELTEIKYPNGYFSAVDQHQPLAFPVVRPPQTGKSDLLVFVPTGYSDIVRGLYYYSVTDPEQGLKPVGGSLEALVLPDGTLSVSVAASTYGITVVAYSPYALKFYFVAWAQLDDFPDDIEPVSISIPSPGHYDWQSAYVMGDRGLQLVCFGSVPDFKDHSLVGEFSISMQDGVPKIDRYDWSRQLGYSLQNMQTGPDGKIYALFRWHQDLKLLLREGPGQWRDQGTVITPTRRKGNWSYASAMTYVPGPVTESPSNRNTPLKDANAQLNRVVFAAYYDASKGRSVTPYPRFIVTRKLMGYLSRTALAKVTPAKKLLLGIIEGPPPIPDENINMPAKFDPRNPVVANAGNAGIAHTAEQSATITANWSFGLVAHLEGQTEGVATQLDASAVYEGMFQSQTGSRSSTTYTDQLRLEQTPEAGGTTQYQPQGIGTVFFYDAELTGYIYEFLTPSRQVSSNSLSFLQLVLLDAHISVVPYAMNPAQSPYPGKLNSYKLTPIQRRQLEQAALVCKQDPGIMHPTQP